MRYSEMHPATGMKRWMTPLSFAAALACLSGLTGCEFEAGAIENEEETGWQERGRDPGSYQTDRQWNAEKQAWTWTYALDYTDVILSPDGNTLLALVPLPGPDQGYDLPGMALVAQALPDGRRTFFPQLRNVDRINFSPDGSKAYLLMENGTRLTVLDLATFTESYTYYSDVPFSVVDATPDGRFLVLSNLPIGEWDEYLSDACNTYDASNGVKGVSRCSVGFVDMQENELWSFTTRIGLEDIDFSTINGEVLFTYSEWVDGSPLASVEFYSPVERAFVGKVQVPNCADEVKIDHVRDLAILSPTFCSQDPISIIDLKSHSASKTLPGFGPVVVSESLGLAVGFTRKADMESTWQYDGQYMDYGLIFVNLDSGEWTVQNYGDHLPAYTISPDGRYVFLYEHYYAYEDDGQGGSNYVEQPTNLSFVDLQTLERLPVAYNGPSLDRYVWNADGSKMYVLDNARLYSISVGEMGFAEIPLSVSPELLNIRPQGDMLVLGESDAPVFHLLPLSSSGTAGSVRPSVLETLDLSL